MRNYRYQWNVVWRTFMMAGAVALILAGAGAAGAGEVERFKWERLPDLPGTPAGEARLAWSGAYIGEHNGALIVAGGVLVSPDSPPLYRDEILALVRRDDGSYRWISDPSFKFASPRASGAAISAAEGLVCAGGQGTRSPNVEVVLLKWAPEPGRIKIEQLPSLPEPMATLSGAADGNTIYLVGGKSADTGRPSLRSWALNLAQKENATWTELPARPISCCWTPAVVVQSNGTGPGLYVFEGYRQKENFLAPPDNILRLNFAGESWSWLGAGPISDRDCGLVTSGAAVPIGVQDIALIEKSGIMAFHTVTGAWSKVSDVPGKPTSVSAAVKWGNDLIVLTEGTGPQIWKASPLPHPGFGALNYAALGLYLAVMVGIGVFFSGREKTTDDYFKAGGRVPWWAAGLSIFGTGLSAITFVSVPAKTFATDLLYFPSSIAQFLAIPVVIALYIPVYRRLKFTTSYEYLEARFNLITRLLGAAMFLLFQFSRFAIVLFLPSLALSLATGIDIKLCIVVMAGLSILYTVMGGIEAVIWTDVLQVVVLMGGSLLALIIIVMDIDGGLPEIGRVALADNKLHTFDFALTLARPTFWVTMLGGFAYTLIYAGSDQTYVQRYQTTATEQGAARSLWTFGILTIPAAIIFYGLGAALYVYYKENPANLDPTLSNADAIFPWFIMSQLPAGVSGLIVAGIFAAAMSSLDSSMNSAAAVVVTDVYRRFRPDSSEGSRLFLAKVVTVVFGLAGAGLALVMTQWKIPSLWDEFQKWIGLIAGGLGGLFLLGILSKRAHGTGAVIGLAGSAVIQYIISKYLPVHLMLFTFTGFASSMVLGYAASLVIPSRPKTQFSLQALRERTDQGPGEAPG